MSYRSLFALFALMLLSAYPSEAQSQTGNLQATQYADGIQIANTGRAASGRFSITIVTARNYAHEQLAWDRGGLRALRRLTLQQESIPPGQARRFPICSMPGMAPSYQAIVVDEYRQLRETNENDNAVAAPLCRGPLTWIPIPPPEDLEATGVNSPSLGVAYRNNSPRFSNNLELELNSNANQAGAGSIILRAVFLPANRGGQLFGCATGPEISVVDIDPFKRFAERNEANNRGVMPRCPFP